MAVANKTAAPGSNALDRRAGKYLIFHLGQEEFGASVLSVKEIMKMQEITTVPQTPACVQGVINLRGKIVPVINLRRKFAMEERENTGLTCIVVMRLSSEHGERLTGIVVDGVVEVLTLNASDIEDAPDFGLELARSYVLGMAKTKGKVRILLDIDQVLSARELETVGIAQQESTAKL
jgi:purine-binding chemotaxis protein CheW